MRTSLIRSTLAILISTGALWGSPADAASVADASVTATGAPTQVSPPGGIVLYRVTVTNGGPAPAPVEVTDVTEGGAYVAGSSQLPPGCGAPADGTANPQISCSFDPLLAGETRRLAIAIRTPATTGSVTNTATVAVPPNALDVFDDNPDNDQATVSTPVLFAGDGSATLLREGESLAFRASVLTVRASTRGVIASMADALGGGDLCGTVPCGDGLHVGFDPDPDYQGSLGLRLDLGKGNPCRGIGAGANCADLYMRKDGIVTKVPSCAAQPLASPCIEVVEKNGPVLIWVVRLASEDPDFIPPINTAH